MAADRFVDDRRRQNALVNAQWAVLRYTWHDLVGRPDCVVHEIRVALSTTE
jgi:very-short-patch-repair endonuclease